MSKVSVIIPTLNAEKYIENQMRKLMSQSYKPSEVIIIDSDSTDRTVDIANSFGCSVIRIKREEFDHGGTRTIAGKHAKGNILVYLTQDAIPVNSDSIKNLISPILEDKDVACAFGRQIPYDDTNPFGKHLRFFNYPPNSYVATFEDRKRLGLRTVFFSNSFSAYKKQVLEEVGWFPSKVIFGEDTLTCGKILKKGYKVAYSAEAVVYHSHSYTLFEEFRRYFDIGVMHRDNKWLIEEFGKPSGKGFEYLFSELKYLIENGYTHLIPASFLRNVLKFIGYNLGKHYSILPLRLRYYLSMNRTWWINKN